MLEELAFASGTDKSRDDHGYVGPYAMLFDPVRERVRNMTEIGVLFGRSLPVWHAYFPNAQIWGLDYQVHSGARMAARGLERVHVLKANSQRLGSAKELGLVEGSMDIILDDADHSDGGIQKTFEVFWPLLRPGGYYVIEDIATGANVWGKYTVGQKALPGFSAVAHHASPAMRRAFDEHDVFFADTLVGSRNFEAFSRKMRGWMKDHVDHNSHILVIRRRNTPRTRPVSLAWTSFAEGRQRKGVLNVSQDDSKQNRTGPRALSDSTAPLTFNADGLSAWYRPVAAVMISAEV